MVLARPVSAAGVKPVCALDSTGLLMEPASVYHWTAVARPTGLLKRSTSLAVQSVVTAGGGLEISTSGALLTQSTWRPESEGLPPTMGVPGWVADTSGDEPVTMAFTIATPTLSPACSVAVATPCALV